MPKTFQEILVFALLYTSFFKLLNYFHRIIVVLSGAKSYGRKGKPEGQPPDPNIFLWTAVSVVDAATVNYNVINLDMYKMGPRQLKNYFWQAFLLKKFQKVQVLYSFILILENIWYQHFT